MKNIKINTDSYLIPITLGNISFVDGVDQIKQDITLALRTFKGEWFIDTEKGLDYFGKIFRKGTADRFLREEVRRAIIARDGVKNVERIDITRSGSRSATINCDVRLDSGDTIEVVA